MIYSPQFILSEMLGLFAGLISIVLGARFLIKYTKDKSSIQLFTGLSIVGIGWVLVLFFIRALRPNDALLLTIIGLIGIWFLFPFSGVLALNLMGVKDWKLFSVFLFLVSFIHMGLFFREAVVLRQEIMEALYLGSAFYVFESLFLLTALIVLIIALVSGLFFYFSKITSGTMRKKSLYLGTGFLLMLSLSFDLLGYMIEFLPLIRGIELAGVILIYIGFSVEVR
ncbi:MAG TPA: hypothetical protein HA232_03840 [Methanocellales archaeon]|nr:hypothetical protein [Methanocellales archaeon]